MDWFIHLQEGLVYIFSPVVIGFSGIIFIGSLLASIVNIILDVAGRLIKS